MRPTVLTIAGTDSSGGAGLTADVKAIEAIGCWATSCVTAVTAQDARGVSLVHRVPDEVVTAQLESVLGSGEIGAVKSGMLATRENLRAVARALLRFRPERYVLDPVRAATSGHRLVTHGMGHELIEHLLPLATLVTPNADEAAWLTGIEVTDRGSAEAAGRQLLDRGARAVLVKGGHLEHDRGTDVLVTPSVSREFTGAWFDTPHTHGTGCVYAAAIAGLLALGFDLEDAVARGRRFVTEAVRQARPTGCGRGSVDPPRTVEAAG